jgi:hypothetical protein
MAPSLIFIPSKPATTRPLNPSEIRPVRKPKDAKEWGLQKRIRQIRAGRFRFLPPF